MLTADQHMIQLQERLPSIYSRQPSGLLYALLYGIARLLHVLDTDTETALAQACVLTATGMWLNLWGAWFAVKRQTDEEDVAYAARIVASVRRNRNTPAAIRAEIADRPEMADMQVELLEHWQDHAWVGSSYAGYERTDDGTDSPTTSKIRARDQIPFRFTLRLDPIIPTTNYLFVGYSAAGIGYPTLTDRDSYTSDSLMTISNETYQLLVDLVNGARLAGIKPIYRLNDILVLVEPGGSYYYYY